MKKLLIRVALALLVLLAAPFPARAEKRVALVVGNGMKLALIGIVIGLGGAVALTRWMATARESIQANTQRFLRERTALSTSDFHTLATLVASQLDLSLARWLLA